MQKRHIDKQVEIGVINFIQEMEYMGISLSEEMIEQYRQELEGIAMRELDEQEGEGSSYSTPAYSC